MAQVRYESPIRARLEALAVGETLPFDQAPVQLEKDRQDFRLWVFRDHACQFWDFELRGGVWRRVA